MVRLYAALCGALAMVLLAGCATSGSSPTLTLTQIQAEAQAVNGGIQSANIEFQASPTATAAQKAASAHAAQAADLAAKDVAALTQPSSVKMAVNEFIPLAQQAVGVLGPVLAINPATGAAISLGLALVQAYVNGVALPARVTPIRQAGVAASPVPVPVPRATRAP